MSERGRSPPRSKPGSASGAGAPQPPAGSRSDSPPRSAFNSGTKWTATLGFDPAKPEEKGNTRMELPPDAYVSETNKDLFTLRGNRLNTEGKPDQVEVNQYRMTKFDFKKKIYQYDIFLSPNPDKLGPVMKKVMNHSSFKNQLAKYKGDKWLFDGMKLAWGPALVERGEIRFSVDLDEGKPGGRKGRDNAKFLVTIRHTTDINVAALQGYLDHKISFSTNVQEALNFLDHLIRQWPSQHLLAIKRNFYKSEERGRPLGDGGVIEVHKGTYASIRMSHNLARGGVGLGYNVDVANTCFWIGRQSMDTLLCNFLATCDRRWNGLSQNKLAQELRPVRNDKSGRWESSDAFKQMRKLRRLKFTVRHKDRRNDDKLFTTVDFSFDEKFGGDGAHARNTTFELDGKQISIFDFYRKKHQVTLRWSQLPLIQAGKSGWIPMELAFIEPMQRYPFKLNPDQTAAMIKIAVTRPQVRRADIQRNVQDLQIPTDPFLREYGVQFEPNFARADARILQPPQVKFANGNADPKFSGRWDLRGKKFWKPNVAPLQNWGFIALEQGIPKGVLQQFADTFRTTFIGHGGICKTSPLVLEVPGDLRFNAAKSLDWAHQQISKAKGMGYTQLLFCVLSKKNAGTYERLKKSADCRFGFMTQCVLAPHVQKNQGQYHSNVAMKVNAKLGGSTSCTPLLWNPPTYFPDRRPTMIIGVDVSHAAPGGNAPSTAAMTMSVDRDATRYASTVETNGYRTELLTPGNIQMMITELSQHWKAGHNGQKPVHIIYFRDGVGEGQFGQVLEQEIAEIKRNFVAMIKEPPKFTVIVATKRHHIRFFPKSGDKNGNAYPGTLVEKEVTHPFMWDFYLCSHVAIQGTARPVHYHVLMDEMKMPVNELQKMIYQQCYSYARSTTPVSLHPAVYYAHLASGRARAHEQAYTSDGFRSGPKGHEILRDNIAKGRTVGGPERITQESPPLLRLGGNLDKNPVVGEERQRNFFRGTMWYI